MVKHLQPVSFEGQPTSQASRNSSSGGVSFHGWLDVGALLPPPTVAGQESRWVMTRPGHQACWKNIPFFWMLRFLDEWWYLYLSVPCNILCHSLSSTNSRRQCWKQNVLDECTSWSTCTLTLTVQYLEWPSEVSACSFLSCTPPMLSVANWALAHLETSTGAPSFHCFPYQEARWSRCFLKNSAATMSLADQPWGGNIGSQNLWIPMRPSVHKPEAFCTIASGILWEQPSPSSILS